MATVLVLGTDPRRTQEIRALLRRDGHVVNIAPTVDGWRGRERELRPDLVVATVDRTETVLEDAGRPSRIFPAPLLFVQHGIEHDPEINLDDRLVDRLASPFMREDLLARVDALVRVRRVVLGVPGAAGGEAATARGEATGLTGKIGSWLRRRLPRGEKPLGAYLDVGARVAAWADHRDAFEPGHAERVTSLCAMMAEGLGMADEETGTLLRAAMLHDVGKVAVPAVVLRQTAPLDETQRRLIRSHPKRGAALVRALSRDEAVADTIMYHHERLDGAGYYGVHAGDIPLPAKVLAVAEVYDAMTSSRLTEPMGPAEALERLRSSQGVALDADAVDALTERVRPRGRRLDLSPDPLDPF